LLWQIVAILLGEEFVACGGDGKQFGAGGDEFEGFGQLADGAEGVANAENEQRGGLEAREVGGS
jgi:hypothetical protein